MILGQFLDLGLFLQPFHNLPHLPSVLLGIQCDHNALSWARDVWTGYQVLVASYKNSEEFPGTHFKRDINEMILGECARVRFCHNWGTLIALGATDCGHRNNQQWVVIWVTTLPKLCSTSRSSHFEAIHRSYLKWECEDDMMNFTTLKKKLYSKTITFV